MKHVKLFEQFVNESTVNEKNGICTIEVDLDSVPTAEFKKLDIKYKKLSGSNKLAYDLTGTCQNLISFLSGDSYEMDVEDIKDVYPELYK